MAGEVDARFESVDALLPDVQQGSIRLLCVFDSVRDPRFPDVPSLSDLDLAPDVKEKLEAFANIYKLERSFVAPPETPADRVEFLRAGLSAVFASQTFQDQLKQAGRSFSPMDGATLAVEAGKVSSEIADLKPLFVEK
jgi:tripartite-type tricarboxylate transporter receptor subunit TctC